MAEPLPPISASFDAAVWQIEQILGPRKHPDCAAVIAVIRSALNSQSRYIAREIRREAAAYQRGVMPSGNQQLTYDGGLRRASRIAEAQDLKPKHRFPGDAMTAPHNEPQR